MNSLCHKKWLSALDECDAHILRINHAIECLVQKLPLTKDAYDFLSENDITYIDQIVFRFSKLQDTIGNKIFPLGLALLGEDIEARPFIDLLNKLEELRVIPSSSKWMEWRKLRNDLTHEYPDVVEDRIAALNNVKAALAEILQVYQKIREIVSNSSS